MCKQCCAPVRSFPCAQTAHLAMLYSPTKCDDNLRAMPTRVANHVYLFGTCLVGCARNRGVNLRVMPPAWKPVRAYLVHTLCLIGRSAQRWSVGASRRDVPCEAGIIDGKLYPTQRASHDGAFAETWHACLMFAMAGICTHWAALLRLHSGNLFAIYTNCALCSRRPSPAAEIQLYHPQQHEAGPRYWLQGCAEGRHDQDCPWCMYQPRTGT